MSATLPTSHDAHAPAAHADAHDSHEGEFEYLDSLNPKPSPWPFLLGIITLLVPVGGLILMWGGPELSLFGWIVLVLGGALSLVPTFGWFHSVVVDKWEGHFGVVAQGNDLALGTKLFFLSEIAIFGSIFAYYFVMRHHSALNPEVGWPLPGSPLIDQMLPAIGLLILLTSSFTCEVAHKALMKGKRGMCKDWMLITMALGLVFLFLQGYEWGFLIRNEGFTVGSNWFGTVFYVLTGFHGLHVITGLIMLMIVYGRLEIGHFTAKRHFSMMAASWYWHLVDVVWVFVFTFIYCFQGGGH
ncbi:MAG: heme-copper oxidase subunit III [Candidatus Sumerlaeia bacterium]|nr:heme-copper oxidase subunit III [Candidatus Sumerlaeia bacterium]